MTVPDIPPPTAEARLAFPQVPVQPFVTEPLPDLAAACAQAQAQGEARLEAARPILDSAAGYGADGFNIEEGSAHGWPADMEPPPYETPLRPGPHGG
jgi:hypothetical protein